MDTLKSSYLRDIVQLIIDGNLSRETMNNVISSHGLGDKKFVKTDLIDVILAYVSLVLEDHLITRNEYHNVIMLKKCFGIREGELLKYREREVKALLEQEFRQIHADNVVTPEEELHDFEIQDMFDIGYDGYERIKSRF
jgi:hypothetical protein